ncbi:hypothetical protein [Roseococcus thiosulfatophilus]|uniref:hypothetical protein n=1 Tax=Roseococcus thiosulfatophilus TaxID=35813 RepID=UPI001A8D56BA|nr:hypothetical protein [Roseococcus thiosulfatophilus]
MSRSAITLQSSFTGGELDPLLTARTDQARYFAGAQRMRNVLVIPQGGFKRRPGLAHCVTLPTAALDGVRLIPFAFSVTQTYTLAFYAGGFTVLDNNGAFLVAYTGQPWTAAIAANLNWVQSADTLILLHQDLPPHRIFRAGSDTSWTSGALPLTSVPEVDFGSGNEPVISSTRGWPECGTFHQGRLWLAGLRSRPSSLLASRVTAFFDFALGTGLDDEGLLLTIDSDQLNAIHQLFSGRALQIFTSGAEHAITSAPPITPRNIAITEQTRRGIRRFARVGEVDGALLFPQRGGAALRQFIFVELEQAYRADLLSLLSPHLIRDPRDVLVRKGSSMDDADHVLLPDSDGQGVTVLTTLREQEVAAFTRWTCNGTVRSAAALASGQVFLAVQRDGAVHVVRWDEDRLLDHSVRVANATPFGTVSGLSHLNGRTVQLVLDGYPSGQAVVSGGAVTLPRLTRDAEVGLGFAVEVQTMPIEPRLPGEPLVGRKARIVSAFVRVRDSRPFLVRNTPVNLRTLGLPPAPPLTEEIPTTLAPTTTGDVQLRGLTGFQELPSLTISQPADLPQPLTVQAVGVTIAPGGYA